MPPRQLIIYSTATGTKPFSEWLDKLRDRTTVVRIHARLDRAETGNLGDCKSIGGGLFELRLAFGPGHWIYFGQHAHLLVILLLGGDKSTQGADIERARGFWANWLSREERKDP